ncbi:MAG: NAD-binding domain-containing oxidoreductase [Candidatus Tokpelaia sp. JSC085]|nr:MAG: NAD-binding domain-containing oxidoreductase [Candidatus Tokpelaia sp. JSC085]
MTASSKTAARYTANNAFLPYKIPKNVFAETVTQIQHYTNRLFKFRITRPANFRFRSGEFVMIGLPNAEKPIYRAYSIASPFWDVELEFFSIKIADGPFTEHLQRIKIDDIVLMRTKSTGTLLLDALLPGKRLYLLSTGTGIAPFASLVRDPETYEKFQQIILIQTTRETAELAYANELVTELRRDPLIGELSNQLTFYPMTTREQSNHMGRITDAMRSGQFFLDTGLPPINAGEDRMMICGSIPMLKDCANMVKAFGLEEGANNAPATYVVERAFVS